MTGRPTAPRVILRMTDPAPGSQLCYATRADYRPTGLGCAAPVGARSQLLLDWRRPVRLTLKTEVRHMSPEIPSHRWPNDAPVPESVVTNLVIGIVRWQRALGLPDGALDFAFLVQCYHFNHGITGKPIRSIHDVQVLEGPHDGQYFRVTFKTYASWPQDWPVPVNPQLVQPLRTSELPRRAAAPWCDLEKQHVHGQGCKVLHPRTTHLRTAGKAATPSRHRHRPSAAPMTILTRCA